MSVRLSINLAPGVARILRREAAIEGQSITETIRHAVGLLALIRDAQRRGERLFLRGATHEREVLLPGFQTEEDR